MRLKLLGLQVEDLLIISFSVERVLEHLINHFELTVDRRPSLYLGHSLTHMDDGLKLSAERYISDLLSRFPLGTSRPVSTPMANCYLHARRPDEPAANASVFRSLVGSLMWIATGCRPDIFYAVIAVSRYMSDPSADHLDAAYRILRYLSGSPSLGLIFRRSEPKLAVYSDSDFASDPNDRVSVSGAVVMLGCNLIHFHSKKQTSVASSSTEAEWLSASLAVREAIFYRMFLRSLGLSLPGPVPIYEDNQRVIASLRSNDHGKLKHLDVALQSIHHLSAEAKVMFIYIPSVDNAADIMTKALSRIPFLKLSSTLGLG